MKKLLLLALFIVGCSNSSEPQDNNSLLGKWVRVSTDLSGYPPDALTIESRTSGKAEVGNVTYSFTTMHLSDTFLVAGYRSLNADFILGLSIRNDSMFGNCNYSSGSNSGDGPAVFVKQ